MLAESFIQQVVREGLYLVLLVSAPAVLVSLLVGLMVNLFQATTQLQDPTLSFVPKLITVLATLAVTGPWIGSHLLRFTRDLLQAFSASPLVIVPVPAAGTLEYFSGGLDLPAVLWASGATLARIGPALWLSPILGGKLISPLPKAGLAFLLALVLSPQIAPALAAFERGSSLVFWALLLKEVMLGASLGFIISLVFWAAEMAGRLADTARQANLAEVLVPQLEERSSPLGSLYFMLSLVLFLSLGGHRILIMTLGLSYQAVPFSAVPGLTGTLGLARLGLRLTANLFLLALGLSAPVLAACFLADVSLGIINRFVPSVSVFFLGMPAKALLGIGVLALSIGLLLGALPPLLDEALRQVSRVLDLVAAG